MKGKKVWHLLSNRWFSAITQYSVNAALSLRSKGHLCLFTPLKDSLAEQKALEYGLDVKSVPSFGLMSLPQLRRIASWFSPDIIYVYGGPEMTLSRFFPGFGQEGKPVIRFRGQALSQRNQQFPGVFRRSHKHLFEVITPGKQLTGKLQSCLDPALQVRTVPLGTDTDRFKRPSLVKVKAWPELLIFGRFDPVKGHERFLSIFNLMLQKWYSAGPEGVPAPRLHIAGKPANISKEDMAELIRAQGLRPGHEVLLTCGQLSDLPQLLATSCIGVIPSLGSEEICRVAQEFLLCGTPVFLSGAGALDEVLFTNAGLSYHKKSDGEASEMLFHFILKSYREDSMSRELRASMAVSHFSLNTMARHLTQNPFYES